MKVLIDGENLRHRLSDVLVKHGKVSNNIEYFKFDLIGFMHDVLGSNKLEIIYYTTRIKFPKYRIPVKLRNSMASISEANRRWIADLTNQGIKVVKAGYLSVRESSSCIHCGKKTLVLQEKGVDVRVAVDLVLASSNVKSKKLVLCSSDSDLLPALEASSKSGLEVSYMHCAGWENKSVANMTHDSIMFDDSCVLKHYIEGKK